MTMKRSDLYKKLSEEQSWFLPDGTEIHGRQAYDYLLKLTAEQKDLYQDAVLLQENIQSVLKSYRHSANIIIDAMNLDELLSNIGLFCAMYREAYERHLGHWASCAPDSGVSAEYPKNGFKW
ncbi:MAG: hypothetical protein VZT48_11605 [Bulleidia sp.]|nr:hypothetical protein [Bulleidia sp.]